VTVSVNAVPAVGDGVDKTNWEYVPADTLKEPDVPELVPSLTLSTTPVWASYRVIDTVADPDANVTGFVGYNGTVPPGLANGVPAPVHVNVLEPE
jgi:hypothetical protein